MRIASSRIRNFTSCSWSVSGQIGEHLITLREKYRWIHAIAIPERGKNWLTHARDQGILVKSLAWIRDNYLQTNGQRTARDANVAL